MRGPSLLPLVLMAGACSGGGGDRPLAEVDAGAQTFGRVTVSLTVGPTTEPALKVEARLVRFRDLDPLRAEILAGARLPALELEPLGRCAVLDPDAFLDEALAQAPADAAVQRLEAGDLVVSVAGRALRVEPRFEADVLPLVSGVTYASDGDVFLPPEATAGGEAYVSASGGEDVGRCEAIVDVAPVPRLQTIGDAPAAPGLVIDRARPLSVAWSTEGRSGAIDDPGVAVTLAWHGRDGTGSLRCRALDTGTFTIAADALAAIPEEVSGSLTLSVERVTRTPFSAPRLPAGEIEVRVAHGVPLQIF